MGFYYDKGTDQERMVSKFDKIAKRNKQIMSENHPDFAPTQLSLKEQFKYWKKKNKIKEEERELKREKEIANPTVRPIEISHRK